MVRRGWWWYGRLIFSSFSFFFFLPYPPLASFFLYHGPLRQCHRMDTKETAISRFLPPFLNLFLPSPLLPSFFPLIFLSFCTACQRDSPIELAIPAHPPCSLSPDSCRSFPTDSPASRQAGMVRISSPFFSPTPVFFPFLAW